MRCTGLDHVNLRVAGAERSLWFYRDVLGLRPERLKQFRAGETSLLTLRIDPGSIIHLRPTEGFAAPTAEELSAAWDHLALSVEGTMDDLVAELAGHGIVPDVEPFDAYGALGHGRAVYVRDPDGYRVELKTVR
jgi:catechol 2,3-dioxygenase-like lactoylglutathione lyase family enzyme